MATVLDVSEDDPAKKFYKCCKSKVSASAVCVTCGNIFHKSCLQRIRGSIQVIDETRMICCQTTNLTSSSKVNEIDEVIHENFAIEKLKLENQMLKQILYETQVKCNLLHENNLMLKENKQLIEEKMEELKKQIVEINIKSSNTKKVNTDKHMDYRSALKTQRNLNLKQDSKISNQTSGNTDNCPNQPNHNLNYAHQENIERVEEKKGEYKDMTQLLHGELIAISEDKDENQFQEVVRRRNKNRSKKNIGMADGTEGSDENGFAGVNRKLWLYVNRVKRHTTCNDIINYLKTKSNSKFKEEFSVKELKTQESQNKVFMIGAPYDAKDELYNDSFWPKGVGYRRFDFGKYRNFLNDQSGDFL